MKMLKKLAVVGCAVAVLCGSANAAFYSGWQYVKSLVYSYEGGALKAVCVYMAPSLSNTNVTSINIQSPVAGTNLLSVPEFVHALSQLERAENGNIRIHYANYSRNDRWWYPGNSVTVDFEKF